MQISNQPRAHLTYCLNVHSGETLADQIAAIRDHAALIRDTVAPGRRFGLGLRISNRASLELESGQNLAELRDFLETQNLYVFTINGFPYGEFHGAVVKEKVYSPDWRTPERRDYTIRLARQLSALLPDGVTGSISTVPGSYKQWIRSSADIEAMAIHLADVAAVLAALRAETGKEIHIGLEPEPDCYIETSAETVEFFTRHLLPKGARRLAIAGGCSVSAAEATLRRHIGVCFDTCHMALQFEDLCAGLEQFSAQGIRISKIQISAAIRTPWRRASAEILRPFCDPVYLHQVKTLVDGKPLSRGDLGSALVSSEAREGEEWRIHFHVPLYFVNDGPIESTASQLTPMFFQRALDLGVEHFEIETYTFDVLPESLRESGVNHSVAGEYRWVLSRMPDNCSRRP